MTDEQKQIKTLELKYELLVVRMDKLTDALRVLNEQLLDLYGCMPKDWCNELHAE